MLRIGGPLEGAEVLAGESGLDSAVTWAVSLRSYAPAIPRMKGNEVALAAVEMLNRQGISLASTIKRLTELGAVGLVTRGAIDNEALRVAQETALPLIRIAGDVPLHEIEQEIIREVVLFHTRREVGAPQEEGAWIEDLLEGRIILASEAQELARLEEYVLPATVSVAYLMPVGVDQVDLDRIVQLLRRSPGKSDQGVPSRRYKDGIVAIVSSILEEKIIEHLPASLRMQLACGIGGGKVLTKAAESFEEAELAALVSARLREGATVKQDELGADGLLALLYREKPDELQRFVDETLGLLIAHDTKYATHLLSTVESFIDHAGRLRETAGDIFVHRNTLAYRLQRAEYLLGKDLKHADTQLAIQMALRAKRFLALPPSGRAHANDA